MLLRFDDRRVTCRVMVLSLGEKNWSEKSTSELSTLSSDHLSSSYSPLYPVCSRVKVYDDCVLLSLDLCVYGVPHTTKTIHHDLPSTLLSVSAAHVKVTA